MAKHSFGATVGDEESQSGLSISAKSFLFVLAPFAHINR